MYLFCYLVNLHVQNPFSGYRDILFMQCVKKKQGEKSSQIVGNVITEHP